LTRQGRPKRTPAAASAAPDPVLASVLEAIPDPVVLVDDALTVVQCNGAARRLWPPLAPGAPLSFTLRTPDIIRAAEAAARGEGPVTGEYEERVPVQRVFSFQATGLGPRGGGRLRPAVVIAFRDLTEARRLEKMRVDFVANASHELRTPPASLLGFVETLEGPARNDASARERFLAVMRAQAQRMARLIDDLLSLSRIELNEHRHPDAPVDLVAVARQVVDTLRPLAAERKVEIVLADHAPVIAPGDRDELLRVADNLIENAIKYGQSGGRVEVSVDVVADGGRDHARLSVRDFGQGIGPADLPRLSERFYRVDNAESRQKGGTGLGLAIVKHIAKRHRGRLTVESRRGEGAVFRVMIPLAEA
jgi:two-component system, OmpR family, phosphate regulon sensor histidine kinase PhoR